MIKKIKQNVYLNFYKVIFLILFAAFLYFVTSSFFYKGITSIRSGELLNGIFFALSCGVIYIALLFTGKFDAHYEITEGIISIIRGKFIKRRNADKITGFKISKTLIMKCFGCVKIRLYFGAGKQSAVSLYVSKDFEEEMRRILDGCLETEKATLFQRSLAKKQIFISAAQYLLYALIIIVSVMIFIYPLFAALIKSAGINLSWSALGTGNYFMKSFNLGLIILAILGGLCIAFSALYLVIELISKADRQIKISENYLCVSKKSAIYTFERHLHLNGIVTAEKTSNPLFRLFKKSSLLLYFAGGAGQRERVNVTGVALKDCECDIYATQLSLPTGNTKKYEKSQHIPLLIIFLLMFVVPIIICTVLSSLILSVLLLPVAAIYCLEAYSREAYINDEFIVVKKGGIYSREIYIKTKKISAICFKSGVFSRKFGLCNAEIHLKNYVSVIYFPALTKAMTEQLKNKMLKPKTVDI